MAKLNQFILHLTLLLLFPFFTGTAANYLCFTADKDGSEVWYLNGADNKPNVEYSRDGNSWTDWQANDRVLLEKKGDKIYVRGNNPTGFSHDKGLPSVTDIKEIDCTYFGMSGRIAATGSVMSLIDGEGTSTTIPDGRGCFSHLFYRCSALTRAPELPATKLAEACYCEMFFSCSNITEAPELPATELTLHCYLNMFTNCTKLSKTPKLPATKLAEGCYKNMFAYTALKEAPELPVTKLESSCYQDMFRSVKTLTKAPKLPATELASLCYQNMFGDCINLTEAPELPASELKYQCYYRMFNGCTKLNYIKVGLMSLDNTIYATGHWVEGVNSPGVFIFPCGSKYNEHGESAVPDNFTIVASPIVIFQNWDGTELWRDTIGCDVVPEYKGTPNPPSRGYNFTFRGWDKPLEVLPVPDIYYYTAKYDYSGTPKYLCFTAEEANSTVSYYNTGGSVNMQYSYDGEEPWTTWEPGVVLTLKNEGDKVYVKGDNPKGFSTSQDVYTGFKMTGRITASGSVMSLIDEVGVTRTIPNEYCFSRLFAGCTALVEAPELTATDLTNHCYDNMFNNCGITKMAELPASNLAEGCYAGMFSDCAKLTEWSSMSALALQKDCYKQMFKGCTSLVYAPSLIAKSMAESCYESMFEGCTSLTHPPVLPAIEMAKSCYESMFSGCTSLTSPASIPGVPMANRSCAYMYSGCTSLTSTGFLGSHNLAPYCYTGMFQGCTNLTRVEEMPAEELAENCYSSMFAQCTSLTKAPDLPATELAKGCYEEMFSECTSLVRAPELSATELKENCYKNMFTRCSSLNYIKVGVLTLDNEFNATQNWVKGVDGPGIFIFPCGSTYDKHGDSEVPDDFQIISSPIVIFQNPGKDSVEIWRDTIACGEVPIYKGPTPTYQEGLVFSKWDKELTALDEQGIYYYTAEYEFGELPMPSDWLKLDAQEEGYLSYENVGGNNPEVEYSVDYGESWSTLAPGEQVALEAGMTVYLRGNNPTGFSHGEGTYTRFNITGGVYVSGSVMSLVDGKGNTTDIPCDYCFTHLFEYCDIVRGPVALSALSMKAYCYSYMFYKCGKLQHPAILPATKLAPYCYKNMYTGSLFSTIPDLPATELAEGCYFEMFSDCQYLEILPTSFTASKLAPYCYCGMFSNCVALYNYMTDLPALELAPYCYKNMFSGCTKLQKTNFLRATKMEKGCYSNMFDGCVNLKEITVLPAETLSDSCYYNMFHGCAGLTEVPDLLATEMKPACYEGMFSGCTNLVKAPELPASELVPSCYKNMFEGCSSLNYIKVGVMSLDNDFEATGNWVSGVDGPGTFIFPCGSTYDKHGISEVPDNFEIITSPIVIFRNPDSTELWRDTIACDKAPVYQGKTPTFGEGYVFIGWDKELVPLKKTGIFYYTAKYGVEGNPAMDNTLCFTAVEANSKIWVTHANGNNPDIQYSVDRGETWIPLQEGDTVTLSNLNDRVYVKGDNPDGFSRTGYTNFGMSGKIEASGSVMSLIDGVGETDVIPCDSCFYRLFTLCGDALVKAPELPATTLTPSCYQFMFTNCTSLKEAPQLPATEMKSGCYSSMFMYCTALEQAPELPATQLDTCCYSNMFSNCYSLKETPELPATELAVACYANMFDRCEKLTKVTELPATKMKESCYSAMFQYCKSLRVAPKLPAKELAKGCYVSMFNGCSVLTHAPELPATELAEECYMGMFIQCECLIEAPELPASELKNRCYFEMFYRCTSLSYIKVGVLSLDNIMQATENWGFMVNSAGTFVFPCGSKYDKHGNSEVPMNFTIISSPIVVFQNPDGTELQRDTVDCETIPVYRGEGPTYGDGLVFQGWDPEPAMATDPGTTYYYTAQYKKEGGDTTTGNWLCFTAQEADSRVSYLHIGANFPNVWYSTNEGKDWKELGEDEVVILENIGDKVYFKGDNPEGFSHGDETGTTNRYTHFVMTGKIAASGSVMSLVDGEGVSTVIPNDYCFSHLFTNCTSLVQAPELPATELTIGCYEDMFLGCTNLEIAPELPATTLENRCYFGMFMNCTNLTQAPELPATVMEPYCYADMFYACHKLENAPVLRSTMLSTGCYSAMLGDCQALVVAPELPATSLAENCYSKMFYHCISLTQAPELPASKMKKECYLGMFSQCKNLVTPPSLPAKTLAYGCYWELFSGCDKLSTAPELPATTLDTMCYMKMFENCTSLTQAPELPATSLKSLSYFNMFKGCTSLNYIKVGIMTLDNEYSATVNWVEGVDGPGVFIFPCGSTYDKHGYSEVPINFEIIGRAYTIDSTIVAEESFTWKGVTYTESALWDDSLQTFAGCDSIIRYRLIINGIIPTPTTILNIPACDSIVLNGITYRENSKWNDTLQTSSGGDSIIIYRLTIHKSSVIDSTIVAEGSFTKEGITYTENTSWNDTLRTAFGCDSIIRYNLEIQSVITEPITRDTSVSACDSYTFKGITYRENSEWNDTMQTASGGDSIVIYHLTLHKGVTVDSTIVAEESFTWKEITYTESTTWNDTLQTIHGCDSIIQYKLIINGIAPTPVVNENISACDSFLFKGITYRENSEWNDTLQTANGGDSIVIYHLTLHKSATVDSSIVAEGSFTWKGTVFTENTSWNDTLQTIHGCDSIVTYHLEIQPIETSPITIDENLSACDSFLFKGITYREDSEWNDTLQAANGGDSIITYHLTIHKGVTVDSSIIAEGSFTWKGTTYTEDASWNDTLQTVNGCDSIVRYSLIVNEEKGPLQLTVEDKLYLVLPGGSETISYELTGGEGSKFEVRYNDQTICSGDVTNDSTVNLTCPASLEPGAYTATMVMYDDEGEKAEKEFTFNVMLPDNKQKSYYVKVWNDVVICRNGDGQFLTFQWYKGRKKCENASQQYFNDITLLDGEYMVYVNDKAGKSYFIEPITYEPVEAAYAITAEPNVVNKGNEFTVTVSGVEPDNLKDARIVVYKANGVVEKILDEVKEENVMRLRAGEFVIVLTVNDGKNANCKVLVK